MNWKRFFYCESPVSPLVRLFSMVIPGSKAYSDERELKWEVEEGFSQTSALMLLERNRNRFEYIFEYHKNDYLSFVNDNLLIHNWAVYANLDEINCGHSVWFRCYCCYPFWSWVLSRLVFVVTTACRHHRTIICKRRQWECIVVKVPSGAKWNILFNSKQE